MHHRPAVLRLRVVELAGALDRHQVLVVVYILVGVQVQILLERRAVLRAVERAVGSVDANVLEREQLLLAAVRVAAREVEEGQV